MTLWAEIDAFALVYARIVNGFQLTLIELSNRQKRSQYINNLSLSEDCPLLDLELDCIL